MTTGIDSVQTVGFRRRMVGRLVDQGYVPEGWEETLLAVPRHVFAPNLVWHLAMSDVTWLLRLVPVTPGTRVCVVGAGLGYLTALLAHRLGDEAVAAVEIDPGVAEDCRQRLVSVGLGAVEVLTADGTVELSNGPPFDIVLSTVIVRQVPAVWLERVRPGGVIVTGFGTGYAGDHVIQLQVNHHGEATGHVIGAIETDWARDHRPQHTLSPTEVELSASGAADTTFDARHPPRTIDTDFATAIRVPNCVRVSLAHHDDLWYIDTTSRSRVHWHRSLFGRYRVDQYGHRRLWDEIHSAYRWWIGAGRPKAEQWLITATPAGTTVELPKVTVAATG